MAFSDECCIPQREPMSHEIMSLAMEVSESSKMVAKRLDEKLQPVCRQEPEIACNAKEALKGYPPYFNDLYVALMGIRSSLNAIEGTISRCEV